jgi:monoamine oxidase
MSTQTPVIIIGSGLAALTAAKLLKQHSPILLEARNRIGGRAHTYTATEQPVDLGCSMIHGYKEGHPLKEVLETYGLVSGRGG